MSESVSGAVGALLSRPAWSLSEAELSAAVTDLLAARERIEGTLAVLLAEAADRGVDEQRPRAYVRDRAPAPLTGARVHRDVRRVRGLSRLPATMQLLLDGAVTAGVLDAGLRGTSRLPEDAWATLDALLAGVGGSIQPSDVDRLVEQCLAMIDPDRLEDRTHAECQDELRIDRCGWGPDTSWDIRGRIHGIRGEEAASIVAQLVRAAAEADPERLAPQRARMAEALLHALRLAADTPAGAAPHGADAHVIILVKPETLAGEPGAPAATTSTGSTVARSTVLAAMCADRVTLISTGPTPGPTGTLDGALQAEVQRLTTQLAGLLPAPLAPALIPLDLARTKRVVSPAQWLALITRDRTCRHPGCRQPPLRCQAHHLREWHADHGPTDLDNLALLCHDHHAELHARDRHLWPCGDGTYEVVSRSDWDRRTLRDAVSSA